MVKLRRITEATDSSHTSIIYNLADTLKKKGINATYSGDKGIRIEFTLEDPRNSKEGKDWLKLKENKDKDFVFKGEGLNGSFYFDIIKGDNGKRQLIVKDVSVKGDKDLRSLQKKLKADKPKEGNLTGRSAKIFVYPEPYIITNLVSPTFQSFLKKLYSKIVNEVGLALSEVVDLSNIRKEYYFIDYDENYNRVNEGYLTEADGKEKEISWKDRDVQKAITDTIKGLEIDKSKTTDKELIFKLNDKNGSLHLQGYMLVLDTDTDDDVPPTNYPVKNKNNLTLDNLLDTIKTVFSRRESVIKNNKESKTESHFWDDDIQSDELTPNKPEPTFYILSGDPSDPSVGLNEPEWDKIVGEENGYIRKKDAIAKAREISKAGKDRGLKYTVYGVTKEPVEIDYFMEDDFWDAIDDGRIEVEEIIDDLTEEKRLDEKEGKVEEAVEDHIDGIQDETINSKDQISQEPVSPVFQDVAKERFLKELNDSLLLAPVYEEECKFNEDHKKAVLWVYLSPSFAFSRLSDIVIPIDIENNVVSIPLSDIPDPKAVFDGDFDSNSLSQFDLAVQKFLVNDAPVSEVIKLDVDNAFESKALVVDIINSMAEDYLSKKEIIRDSLDITGESLLKESRYFIVPSNSDLTKEVKKLNSLGYTDLNLAKKAMKELADSGQYNFDLGILDTNFSNNQEKWVLL